MGNERQRILELVQKGTISVQEGLNLLEKLEQTPENDERVPALVSTGEEASEDSTTAEEKNFRKANGPLEQARSKVLDFVNTAVKKVKDLDLSFQQSVELLHVFEEASPTIESIDLDVANGKVELKKWDQPGVRIECHVKVYRTEDEAQAEETFRRHAKFSVEKERLTFHTQFKWMKVDTVVYVPAQRYEDISVRLFNGGFQATHFTADSFSAKTGNGLITLSNIQANELEAETGNGRIKLVSSKVTDLQLETINGKVEAEGEFASAALQSVNGNVTAFLKSTPDTLKVKAVTGSIEVFLPETAAINGELKSNVGSFKVDVEGIEVIEEQNDVVQKKMTFKKSLEGVNPVHLYGSTNTGSVQIKTVPHL
ncbi:DUF4097 family beta strand repeat-containing protein [Mangrovibacillus cuniculi]|uniref:DUF4097 domain-containing protein n=1 Tax=Mangrovibacillus cuniculi TaxID=2593652 RepID=A0A7S8CCI1_9BACI|nr:DUF4097 domain-containing protein [Mangrovibacillus cuniculi]QPC47470.1 DUF4097 domain-containing protein [Mangrovibacillus cuniculi]